ncbi:MAG: hypothetical protein ABJG47_12660 [Ekhidna sp.]
MKTRTMSRIIEGIFLFALIIMIYAMSIFSASGQMLKKFSTPQDLMLSYVSEQSFDQERIRTVDIQMTNSNLLFERIRTNTETLHIPNYLINEAKSSETKISFPKPDLRRKRMKQFQAPSFIIPLN